MLKALVQTVTPFEQNASILFCSETKKCAIVDPGGDIDILLELSKKHDLIPEKILLTHGHIDHAGGATEIAEILNVEIHGPHTDDKFLLDSLQEQGTMFGMNSRNCSPDFWLNEGDVVKIGQEELDVYLCPGHTPGHVIFYSRDSKLAIVGDVLFNGSIGRTDLPGGNFEDLIKSVKNKLWPLGDDIEFIWNNRKYLYGHNKWLIQLIKSNHHKDINKILTKERKIDCKYLKCSKVCNKDFKPEDSIICLYPYIDNTNVIDFILSKLSLADTNQLKTYLPYLVYLLRFNNEQNIKITDYLIYLSSINYFFCNYFFCELNTQLDNSNIYIEIRNKLLNKIQKTSKDYLNDSYNFNNNLIYIIHNSSSIDNFNLIFKNHFESKNYNLPISLGINPNILIYDIAKNSNIKNSNSKPMVLSFKTNDSKYSLLYKKEDLRTDLLVMNIISLIDEILKEEENLDLHIIKYNVLPINNEEGFIEIIPNSKTLYDIDKEGFTLQNYIIEKNKNKPIHTWRSKFTKSCAFYCVISYLLGFGDRHLENIMINDQGILFHIDFTYILGKDPKILFPEIRITQDMVDCMGGVESIYYKEFEKLCAIIYNCLRRHFNLFQVLLYMLHHYDPKIKLNYSKDYINKYIVHKFFPNEENKEARIFIINKMSKFVTRNYSDSFVDICHNYAKDSKILDKYNSVLKYLNNS